MHDRVCRAPSLYILEEPLVLRAVTCFGESSLRGLLGREHFCLLCWLPAGQSGRCSHQAYSSLQFLELHPGLQAKTYVYAQVLEVQLSHEGWSMACRSHHFDAFPACNPG